jgi:hypothetical protein
MCGGAVGEIIGRLNKVSVPATAADVPWPSGCNPATYLAVKVGATS